jgi:hypothetical protein
MFSSKATELAGAVNSERDSGKQAEDAGALDTYELAPLACVVDQVTNVASTAAAATSAPLKNFKVDSGAQVHICNCKEWFSTISPERRPTSGVAEKLTYTSGVGDIIFTPTTSNGVPIKIVLKDVYYIPGQKHNLISFGKLVQAGFDVRLDVGKIMFNELCFNVPMENGLFPWREQPLDDVASIALAATTPRVPRDRADWQIIFSHRSAAFGSNGTLIAI